MRQIQEILEQTDLLRAFEFFDLRNVRRTDLLGPEVRFEETAHHGLTFNEAARQFLLKLDFCIRFEEIFQGQLQPDIREKIED